MKPPREFGAVPRVRYRPELRTCPHCGTALAYRHPVWRKTMQSLTGLAHVTSLGYRCPQPACAFGRTVYRSARAEARQVKGSGYGLDVVVRIGHLRFTEHRTRAEIWRELDAHSPVAISERHVQNLLEVYLALLRASQRDVGAQVAATVAAHGGIVVALDGLQPDEGDDAAVGGAGGLERGHPRRGPPPAGDRRGAGGPAGPGAGGGGAGAGGGQRRPGGRSAWRWPTSSRGCPTSCASGTPCGRPPSPCGRPTASSSARPRRRCARCGRSRRATRRGDPAGADPAGAVVLDAVLALRQTVGERGALPFAFAAPRVVDRLAAVGQTLDRCLARGGLPAGRPPGAGGRRPGPLRPPGGRAAPGAAPAARPGPHPGAGRPRPGPPAPQRGHRSHAGGTDLGAARGSGA